MRFGKTRSFEGNFSEFWRKKKEERKRASAPQRMLPQGSKGKRDGRKERKGLGLEELEGMIQALEEEKGKLEEEADSAMRGGEYTRSDKMLSRIRKLEVRLDELYDRWEQTALRADKG